MSVVQYKCVVAERFGGSGMTKPLSFRTERAQGLLTLAGWQGVSLLKDDVPWIKRGRQRSAVAHVLRKPMTTTEICAAVQQLNARIQLRDIWHLMQEMQERGLAECLNPRALTGKVYALTSNGRRAVATAFGTRVLRPVQGVDWRRHGWVVRGRIRRLVLVEVARPWAREGGTASEIRRHLRDRCPVALNPTVRALKELEHAKLVKAQRDEEGRPRRRYRLTTSGVVVARQLLA